MAGKSAKDDLLKEFVGSHVAVFTSGRDGEHRDEGLLEAFDGTFLRVVTANSPLLFPLASVRLIEPLFHITKE